MKSSYSYVDAPRWCPDAIPSAQGWRHPKTNELLVSIPGGLPVFEKPVLKEVVEKPILDERVQEKTVLDETVNSGPLLKDEESAPVITEKVTKPRGRKAAAAKE